MVKNVVAFKEENLPLHGTIWKQISQLGKESCRMKNAKKEDSIETYVGFLKKQEQKLREQQQQKDMSDAMVIFITGISQPETERLYFLKWLKIQLDTITRQNLATLRQQYKECCSKTPQNKGLIKKLDEQISNYSLGPEHFFRELGQIYECARSLPQHEVQHLPGLCAQMLLDGFPVELVDGDASNIPMKWISAVLTQLHQLVDNKSRILVLTVLGVQSTGKSTLLNTMFGVQFAVSSGRCTRGAFMLLMRVSEELRPELNCDFIMAIDTEGLKSPELAALDTGYEHDNELATLVIGLSDITIINVAMENNTEMKDVLQIVVHAFLRMKEVGKKPRCVFVHQNVSDMYAHDNNMRDRNKLVEQLNEMTQAAAKMEKKKANTKFTDVIKYDPDKDSYYIPGLWHGTPPMAPVNTGYSEAVYELKKNLILLFKSDKEANNDATEFLEWTKSLWKSVKYENFMFNFRNSLVADAYSDLCTHYNSWEWTFQSEMNRWLIAKTTEISSFRVPETNFQISQLKTVLSNLVQEAKAKSLKEETKIQDNIQQYFKQNNCKVALVEKYKQDFQNSVRSLRLQTENSLKQHLEQAVEIKIGMEKVRTIKDQQTKTIEKLVLQLIKDCRERRTAFSEDELNREFDKMWTQVMSELPTIKLTPRDVFKHATHILRENLSGKGGHVSEMLSQVNLKKSGSGAFTVNEKWFSSWTDARRRRFGAKDKQEICDNIIAECHTLINNHIAAMRSENRDYSDTYIKELLKYISDKIQGHDISDECEAHLKCYIIGFAACDYQEAHNEFSVHNNPLETLKTCKNIFLDIFLASFNEKYKCFKKAVQFTDTCVKTAVQGYVSRHLGQEIAYEMMRGDEGVIYNTQANFQFAVLKQLLEEHSFEKYKKYIMSYEAFMENCIKQQIIKRMSASGQLPHLEKRLLSDIVKNINLVINSSTGNMDIHEFMQQFCSALQDQLVIPRDAYKDFLFLLSVDTDQFIPYLKELIKDMEESLAHEYDRTTGSSQVTNTIEQLPCKPHDLLFSRLCGCGQQCPFCGTPCDAGGGGHIYHFSCMHRPQAFAGYAVTRVCTAAVISDIRFKNSETNGEWHPYRQYREIYPDWDIAGDPGVEASDYWKYVMKEFNNELAEAHTAKPADIPEEWKRLTQQDALTSLRRSFSMR